MKTQYTNNIHDQNNNHNNGTPQPEPRTDGTDPVETPPAAAPPNPPRRVPGFLHTQRQDSPLWRLPEHMQDIIIDYLQTHSLLDTVDFLKKSGLETSKSALARFRSAYQMRMDRFEDEASLEMAVSEPDESKVNLSDEELFKLGQRRLMARAIRLGDDKAWARLQRLRQQEQFLALQARRIKAIEDRNELLRSAREPNGHAFPSPSTHPANGNGHTHPGRVNGTPAPSGILAVDFAPRQIVPSPAPSPEATATGQPPISTTATPTTDSASAVGMRCCASAATPTTDNEPLTTDKKSPCSRGFPPVPTENNETKPCEHRP
jgi:hypothetical protein